MHKYRKMTTAFLLAVFLLSCLTIPMLAKENEDIPEEALRSLVISSEEEFEQFARDCVRDVYSQNLQVSLTADLDFTGREFRPVPSFSGTFEGNRHTIKGIALQEEGSVLGLFRYLTETAVVKDLTVLGEISPTGSRTRIGGIAGSNAGTIKGCKFKGQISSVESAGGIAGINQVSGIIEDCMVSGSIRGSHFIGGVAGENYGVIRNCKNLSSINIREEDNKIDSVSLTPGFIMGKEAVDTATDLGGIAGTNSGVIRSCANHGNVGYPKMGYNLGGICGSQKGYVVDCKNHGTIQGRKEIAGIAGQLEPVIEISFEKDTLQLLREQLNNTSALANRASNNIHANSKDLKTDISNLHSSAETAIDAVESLLPKDGKFPDKDTLIAAHNSLSSSLGSMQGSLSSINSSTHAMIGTAAADIRAINDSVSQIAYTLDTAGDHLGGTITDISDLDTEDNLTGKIQDCHNSGMISGDLNVGGIAGAVAWENDKDPEDDYSVSGDRSLNFDSQLRAVILNCSNTAKIQVNKRNAGGIAGNMTLGLAKNCTNTGFIEGQNADYIGGIAGTSLGFIRGCNVKGKLQGSRYMGGIAGSASIVSDCRSTIMMDSGAERLGSVIGYPEEDRTQSEMPISGNYYLPLADHLGAIDGIDYYEKADSLSKQEFLALPDLSPLFFNASMTFQYPDGSTQKITVPLGDVVPESKIPAPPRKEGYIGKWDLLDELDLNHMFFNVTLEAAYTPTNTVLSSDLKNQEGKPFMLAEGNFGEQEFFHLEETSEIPDRHQAAAAWLLPKFNEEDSTRIHLLIPQSISVDSARALIRNSAGEWTETPAEADGSYLVFTVDPDDQAVSIYGSQGKQISMMLSLAGGAALVLILTVIIFRIRKTKQKKNSKSEKA